MIGRKIDINRYKLLMSLILCSPYLFAEAVLEQDPTQPSEYNNTNYDVLKNNKNLNSENSELLLTAIFISNKNKFAIINGSIIKEGDEINGKIIKKIENNKVSFLDKGKVVDLKLLGKIKNVNTQKK